MKNILLILLSVVLSFGVINAQCTILHDLNGVNGKNPGGRLTLSGSYLYGVAGAGGANGLGCIFSIDTNGSGYRDLYDIISSNRVPSGQLVISGKKLFGMSHLGGANLFGCIFSLDTDGSNYKDIFDFNNTNGANPSGSLTITILGNKLYGMTEYGGLSGDGCIFSIDTNGSGYKDIYDFSIPSGYAANGSLIMSEKWLYGMTNQGGANGNGNIFYIDTSGSGYTDIFDFNGTNGAYPNGSLILSRKVLFGIAIVGSNDSGRIFSLDTNGQGYKDLHDFTIKTGVYPEASLALLGSRLIGTASSGGASDSGCVFSIDTNGNNYMDEYDFNGVSGENPVGTLTFSGSILYGTTSSGGTDYDGVIFKMDTTTVTGIESINRNSVNVKLSPNPNNGKFTLQLSEPNGDWLLEIYDMLGEKVYSNTLTSSTTEIDLSGKPAGVYLYRILSEQGQFIGSGRLIIE